MRRLTLVTTARDQGPRLVEWLAFHRAAGVRDVVVYDDESRDDTAAILAAHKALGVVRVPWPEARGAAHLLTPQDHFLAARSRFFPFAVFLDLDEFLMPLPGDTIERWLRAVPPHAGTVQFAPRAFAPVAGVGPTDLVLRRFAPAVDGSGEERRPARGLYRHGAVTLIRDALLPEVVQGERLGGDLLAFEGDVPPPSRGGPIRLVRCDGAAATGRPDPTVQDWIGPTLTEMRLFLADLRARDPGAAARFRALSADVAELDAPVAKGDLARWRRHQLHRRRLETAGRTLRRMLLRRGPAPWA
ncbi:glycosyltransferase family 2 protein [Methylorubrum sp. SB2]|uniref:glycosyltransferase family 2 protein n=1 Tax=Methylorubrum subtropicum TaxID=3138812 RepID=UPI00313B1E4F